MSVANDFRRFLLSGPFVSTAVALSVGAAFTAVVTSFVTDLISPAIGLMMNGKDFTAMSFQIGESKFSYGKFINSCITFITVAFVIFFMVVRPLIKLNGGKMP